MKSLVVKRSVIIENRYTSVSVEEEFWQAFARDHEIATCNLVSVAWQHRCESTVRQSVISYSSIRS
jgi:hypothetical protein